MYFKNAGTFFHVDPRETLDFLFGEYGGRRDKEGRYHVKVDDTYFVFYEDDHPYGEDERVVIVWVDQQVSDRKVRGKLITVADQMRELTSLEDAYYSYRSSTTRRQF